MNNKRVRSLKRIASKCSKIYIQDFLRSICAESFGKRLHIAFCILCKKVNITDYLSGRKLEGKKI